METDGPDFEAHENFEVFCDGSYYDMWCVRPKGSKDFNSTLHFTKERDAIHASHTIAGWMKPPQSPPRNTDNELTKS